MSTTATLPIRFVYSLDEEDSVRDYGEDLISVRHFLKVSGCDPEYIYYLFTEAGVTIYHDTVDVFGKTVTIDKIKLFELVLFLEELDRHRHLVDNPNFDKLTSKRFFRDVPERPYLSYCRHLLCVLSP